MRAKTAVLVRGVILDIDGTLVDSNTAHAQAFTEAFREQDVDTSVENVQPLVGMGSEMIIAKVAGLDPQSERGQRIRARKAELFKGHYGARLQPFLDVRPFVQRLVRDGHRVAVASASTAQDTESLLALADVADLIPPEMRVSGDDIPEPKPRPHSVMAAVDRLGLKPREVLMIGDTPYDIEAAKQAGVDVIAVRSGGWSDAKLKGALAVYDDIADLHANYGQTPLQPGSHRHLRAS